MKKICVGCGRNRKIGKFARDSNRPDGKRIYCRDCISMFNKRYRISPVGRINHKKSVDKWKRNHKTAIKLYNQEYYLKNRTIILYNKRAREETESVLIFDNLENKLRTHANKINRVHITINPKRKWEANPI